ncbi:MAG: hypothetical protein OHK0052_08430 [Anaerolineales bacterium]
MVRNFRIVSVEDEEDTFNLLQLTLRDKPIDWHHAANGTDAVEILTRIDPDLVLLDVMLPDMSGWDVLDQLRAQGRSLDGVPIIVLTARTEMPHRMIAAVQEVAEYLPKPFSPADLRKVIKRILGI